MTPEDLAADAYAYLPAADAEIDRQPRFVLRHAPNPHPMLGLVLRQRMSAGEVEEAVADARAWFAARGRTRFAWAVADTASPPDLVQRLLALGLQPFADDPVYAGMILDEEPPAVPFVDVRRIETFEDELAAAELTFESFDLTEEQRAAAREGMRERWEQARAQDDGSTDGFLASIDGRVVGAAGARYTDVAVYLAGGNVATDARGRGVYRALVRARWDAAAARGTPVLIVQAGRQSRPILDRVGFRTVCEVRALVDETGDGGP
jgi:predicted N-acetyltransferase YhbS